MDFEHSLGRYVGRVNYLLQLALGRALAEAGADITADQFRMLTHLWKEEGLSQQSLGHCTGRDRGSIARMLDILERKAIIHRKPDPQDGRLRRVYLTPAGRDLEAVAARCAEQVLVRATQGLSPREEELLRDALARVRDNLVEENQP